MLSWAVSEFKREHFKWIFRENSEKLVKFWLLFLLNVRTFCACCVCINDLVRSYGKPYPARRLSFFYSRVITFIVDGYSIREVSFKAVKERSDFYLPPKRTSGFLHPSHRLPFFKIQVAINKQRRDWTVKTMWKKSSTVCLFCHKVRDSVEWPSALNLTMEEKKTVDEKRCMFLMFKYVSGSCTAEVHLCHM